MKTHRAYCHWLSATVALSLLVVLAACAGSPSQRLPDGMRAIQGQVVLPVGHNFNLGSLRVTTPYGDHPVDSSGRFTANVDINTIMELGVETAGGDLLLLGTSQGNQVQLSAQSTATALLYYAVGGMWLPTEHQNKVRTLLEGVSEADGVAGHISRILAAGGNGLADPDQALLGALEQAASDLLLTTTSWGFGITPSDYSPMAEGDSNVIIHSGTTTRSGGQVLHDPNGSGIVVLNEFRRPAALLIYEVATDDAGGTTTPVNPPRLAATIDVPATGKLEVLNAIKDVLTGDAPFAPVMSPPTELFGVPGAAKTHYELVLIGAAANTLDWPIVADSRFSGELGHWNDVYVDKALELFLDEMLLPIIETYALGKTAAIDAAKLSAFRQRTRIIYGKHLSSIGVYLSRGEVMWAEAIKAALFELANNATLRNELLDAATEALSVADRNRVNVQAMERRLSSRASASAIAAAVQGIMLTGDMTGILMDITASHWAVNWQAESTPVLFVLTPTTVQMNRLGNGQATFKVEPKDALSGTFLYRWSTSGNHGTISDYFQDDVRFDTDSNEVFYTHNTPLHMVEGQTDTVTVEVFGVDPGATSIPLGAEPIFRRTATITVVEDEFCRGKEPWCDDYYCWCFPGS